MPCDKIFLSANTLLNDAFSLGANIIDSGFKVDVLIALWRGGTVVGMAIQELLSYTGVQHQHHVIKSSHYAGIDSRHREVVVEGLDAVLDSLTSTANVLLVDDVFDTGLTLDKIATRVESALAERSQLRIATPYFKPGNNLTQRTPDYFLYETDHWIVFPHEIVGLSVAEILSGKKELPSLKSLHVLVNNERKSP